MVSLIQVFLLLEYFMDRNETILIVFLEELERLEQEFLQLERNISFFEFQYRSFINILFRIFEVMD